MTLLNIVDVSSEFSDELPEHPYTFPLDTFQKYAIKAISKHENVLVSAKTGSGKTLVGEFQIYTSLKKSKKVFYLTPIKSLSNQKFNDLKKLYGRESVGIITGDIKFQPQAPILVMTTEILRNLLYKEDTVTQDYGISAGVTLDNLDAVIFDEFHYINDTERGKVWEETLILLKPEINLVLLSATIKSPELFGEWLATIKNKPINVISTLYRIVPLTHYICDVSEHTELIEVINSNNNFKEEPYKNWITKYYRRLKMKDEHKQLVKTRREDEDVVTKTARTYSPLHSINKCIVYLEEKEMLPALFFIFSRADCERYAKCIEKSLVSSCDSTNISHIIDFHLHKHRNNLEHLEQFYQLKTLLVKGVAYHHSGLLPVLKEIVEILFNKGFIKALFATETFSVGINMPTKTVVFLDFSKYDDHKEGFRFLDVSEYTQMAGRAGRRGLDTLGYVLYLPVKEPITNFQYKEMTVGMMKSSESRLDFGYDFLLKMLHKRYNYEDIMNLSFDMFSKRAYQKELEKNNEEYMKSQTSLKIDEFLSDLIKKTEIEIKLKESPKNKDLQRELNLWNNKHIGPKWIDAGKKYGEWKQFKFRIESNIEKIKTLYDNNIEDNLNFLKETGFIDVEGKLTHKGLLATELNQSHCLLLSEAYIRGYFNSLTSNELLSVCSIFLDRDDKFYFTDSKPVNVFYNNLMVIRRELEEREQVKPIDINYWKFSKYYCDVILDWSNGASVQEISNKHKIFPGNLYRVLMSLMNIVEELISIASISNDVTLLEKITVSKSLLLRDIAISDSLYLKM